MWLPSYEALGIFDYAQRNLRIKGIGLKLKMDAEEKQKGRTGGSYGVQSAITVLQVLSAFIGAEPMPMLKTLAERTGMHPAKVHRYLVSLCRMGFIEQDEASNRYRLGPMSMRLGFASFSAVDAIRVTRPLMADFCNKLQQTTVLAMWVSGRPTLVLRETLPGLLVMTANEGYVLPLLRSSIGNVFGAYLPREKTASLIEAELERPTPGAPQTSEELEALFKDVRQRGIARTTGQLDAATHSFAAPVYDASGEVTAVLCALGPSRQFNSNWSSPIAKTLLLCASEISKRLGFLN